MTADRHRDYSWPDPASIAAAAPLSSGLDFLHRIISGEVPQPPIASTLEFALVAAEIGRVTLEAHPSEYAYNAIGSVHGGVIATWADTSIGYAIQTHLSEGKSLTTLDLQVRYLRPIHHDTGTVTIIAWTDHVGRRTGTAHAEIRDARERLLATATSTCLVLDAA
ncbi:PaaI family thioesterase [Frondihabitans cladoniiphilus]|uniref:PaaI family thioesterase n=1 Tax=Frondihabitans cladoniiphilus TaxID=715785 RepID=A0ABP8WD97_9MICO